MIEEIKKLSPKLHAKCFADPGVFNDRKIRVIETWSDNDIATKVAEALHRREHGRIEPSLDPADRRDRPGHVGPERVAHPIHSSVTGYDVHRTAALKLNDGSHLPTIKQ